MTPRRLTRVYKETACQFCTNCDQRALRKRWNHCKSEYKPRNGHCENLEKTDAD